MYFSIMGCYCCGCSECAEKLRSDAYSVIIISESNSLNTQASDFYASLKSIETDSFVTDSVDNWNRGDYQSYQRFLVNFRTRKLVAESPDPCVRKMTEKHYEAATKRAVEYFKANKGGLQEPDFDWPKVVYTLACNFDEIRTIEKKIQKHNEAFAKHVRDRDTMAAELKAEMDKKIIDVKTTDNETDMKMRQLQPLLEKLLAVSKDCVMTLKAFYVDVQGSEDSSEDDGGKLKQAGKREETKKEESKKEEGDKPGEKPGVKPGEKKEEPQVTVYRVGE